MKTILQYKQKTDKQLPVNKVGATDSKQPEASNDLRF
jgi:hypothetical protein